jgi:hypothetical protein
MQVDVNPLAWSRMAVRLAAVAISIPDSVMALAAGSLRLVPFRVQQDDEN